MSSSQISCKFTSSRLSRTSKQRCFSGPERIRSQKPREGFLQAERSGRAQRNRGTPIPAAAYFHLCLQVGKEPYVPAHPVIRGLEQAAKKVSASEKSLPQRLKPDSLPWSYVRAESRIHYKAVMYGLKGVPFKELSFSAACLRPRGTLSNSRESSRALRPMSFRSASPCHQRAKIGAFRFRVKTKPGPQTELSSRPERSEVERSAVLFRPTRKSSEGYCLPRRSEHYMLRKNSTL